MYELAQVWRKSSNDNCIWRCSVWALWRCVFGVVFLTLALGVWLWGLFDSRWIDNATNLERIEKHFACVCVCHGVFASAAFRDLCVAGLVGHMIPDS